LHRWGDPLVEYSPGKNRRPLGDPTRPAARCSTFDRAELCYSRRVEWTIRPVGYVRSPFLEKVDAPRQPGVAEDARGTIEILAELEDALADLEGFERIWLLFWFDRAEHFRAKVLPPRSDKRRGVFATRSPHRPNPIGMSVVRLERVRGTVLHVNDLDLLDGTPILDIKPYLAYADAFPDAAAGWLERADPTPPWSVRFDAAADEQLAWLANAGVDLKKRIGDVLALGPQPHAYRRIKKGPAGDHVLAVKEWRVRFRVEEPRMIVVEELFSGYRRRELDAQPLHAAFVARFG
jgi:tRNA (adenine37-N6)-methyltransferase